MRLRILLLLLFATSLYAEETLDNAAIVRMVGAGLSIDVVMTKIEKSRTSFDTSVDALISLKSDGVPDQVIKAMLVKSPTPVAAPAPAVAAIAQPKTDSPCVHVQYYSLEGKGWDWRPALLCAGAAGIDIDEQTIPYDRVTAHCFVASLMPRGDQEWWFSDGTDVHKFRTRGNELQSVSDLISRTHGGIPHGSCGDRAVRKLLPQ